MSLDKNALAAAIAAWKSPRQHDSIEGNTEAAICAYLAALPTTSEPVAWRFNHTIDPSREPLFTEEAYIAEVWGNAHGTVTPLYAHPAPSEPVSDLVKKLLGADVDHVSPVDALRLHDQNSAAFPLSPEDVESVLDLIDRAASALTAAEARAAEAEKALEALERNCVPLSADGRSVFIDGTGDVDLDWKDERLKRAEAAEAKIAELEHRSLAEGRPTHRHKKRGTEYVLIGYGKMQAESWFERNRGGNTFTDVDMREVAIYRPVDDGSLWARPREEFEDGRFEVLPQPPEAK